MPTQPRPPRPRGVLLYDKPAMSLDELVGRLAERGMRIPDRARAVRYLRHIGYYRLSAYTIPFQASRPHHVFRPDTSFDDILDLYVFDRVLRLLVMDALERIEVAVRSAITDHMSTTYDDPFWYTDARYFASPGRHAGLLRIVRETSDARLVASPEPADTTDTATPGAGGAAVIHRSALEHYLTTYASPELPPSWLMIETLTVGQLASVYRNLRARSDRTNIAASLG